MTDRMTCATGPDGDGIAEYGRKTRPEMIKRYRQYYRDLRNTAEAALAAADDEIVVETYLGVHVRRDKEVVE